MSFERFEKNLTDNIREAQLKLGYDGLPMSLNYMFTSLGHLLGCEAVNDAVVPVLDEFIEWVRPRLGDITYRSIKDGLCLTIPARGTAFVHDNTEGSEFIAEFVETVRSHGISLDDVLAVFRRHSEKVTVQESGCEDFDYLVYFTDDIPDEYRYCLTLEPCMGGGYHIIYHRFIAEDYEDFGF